MPTAAVIRRLKLSPEVAWYLVSRGISLPRHPPKIKTPEPRRVPGAAFDPERVDRVLAVFHELRHTKGRLAGKPLDPDPWEVAYIIAPVFGWVHQNDQGDWVRIINEAYVEVPRKNGKSTIAGGIGIYLTCSDNEAGAEVVAAATTKDQAGFVFAPIKKLAETSPAMKGKVRALAGRITHPRTGSYFQVISSVGDAQHGANLHGAIVDELHLHKTPDIVEAVETGTGSRDQPLIVFITTADEGKPNTIYSRKRDRVERLAARIITAPNVYGVVFAADEKDDPFAELTWEKANPGYPISPTKRYLQQAALEAQQSPAQLAVFQRLHLNLRTKQRTRFVLLRDWDRNAGSRFSAEDMRGERVFGGVDLASVSDITSLCWLFPRWIQLGDRLVLGYRALWRNWIPEAALDAINERTAGEAAVWVRDGHLELTPGDVTDYDFIRDNILEGLDLFDVQSIGFDPYNATHLTNDLLEAGAPMVKVRQGMITLSPPTKEVQRLTKLGRRDAPMIEHGGNPVARWAVDNLAVVTDSAGNVKPDKENSGDKIDPFAALVTAMSEALNTEPQRPSSYSETEGVAFV